MSSSIDLFLEKFFSQEDLNTIAYNNRHGEFEPLSEEDKFILEEIFGKGGTPIKITGDDIYPTDKKYEERTLDLVEQTNESYYKSLMSYELIELDFTNINNNKQMEKELSFGEALDSIRLRGGMRLPQWSSDVIIRVQQPTESSDMSAPYLYVESRFGKVPWKETMIELFSTDWVLVE